jgi:hypothetical protein
MLLLTGCFAAGNTLVSLKYQTIITKYYKCSQTFVQQPPLGLKKVAVVKKWLLLTVCSYKIAINFGKLVIRLVVEDRWQYFRGGHEHRFDCM